MRNKEEVTITEICQEYSIIYNLHDINFIEKDTRKPVNLNQYSLLVIREGNKLKLDGFYSLEKIDSYLQQVQTLKGETAIYEDNKELSGYILIDKEEEIKDFIDFYATYVKPNTENQTLKHPINYNSYREPNSITRIKRIGQKYKIFDYLKVHEYLIDVNINGKLIMCLDTKGNTINNVINHIVECTKCSPRICLTRYLNLFGFNWRSATMQYYILEDIKTFEEYYLPFNKLFPHTNYENSLTILSTLYDFYHTPLPKNKAEEDSLKAKINIILVAKSISINHLLEKHSTYPN